MKLSSCGIDCEKCRFSAEMGGTEGHNCPGCYKVKGVPFWGSCDLYRCAKDKSLTHCGLCLQFPCEMLNEWAKHENDERIDNLKTLI